MPKNVLLVDDDPDVLAALRSRLEVEGFCVTTCRSFIEAADHLKPQYDGVVITDLRMPGRSGQYLVEKAHALDPELPVIVLTGFAETDAVVKAMRGGATTVLEKPCAIENLLEILENLLDQRKALLRSRMRKVKDALRRSAGRAPQEHALSPQLAAFERDLIQRALRRNNNNKDAAARELGISRSKIYARIKFLNI